MVKYLQFITSLLILPGKYEQYPVMSDYRGRRI